MDNHPDNIDAAFDMLLEELEEEIELVNRSGARAFEAGDYDTTRDTLGIADQVNDLRDRLVVLRKEWKELVTRRLPREEEEAIRQQSRRNFGRLQRGLRTTEDVFRIPILRALRVRGGRAAMSEVLTELEQSMKGVLKDVDHEPLESDPNMLRWRNTAQWARYSLVKEGYLRDDSPRGVWELTDEGRAYIDEQGM